jgi:Initiator Replication protein
MKKKYRFIIISFVLVAVIFYSCNSDEKIIDELYKQREYLLKEFKDKSVISRSEIFYQLSYYQGQSANTFYFEKKNGVLVFTNDTIQYPINEIAAFTSVNIADSLNYRKALSIELSRLLKVMYDFKISHVSADDRYAGIDMKIYFGDYKALLYVKNVAEIKNERWREYINTAKKKFDNNWYYTKDE